MNTPTHYPKTPQNGSQAVLAAIAKILVDRGQHVRRENEKPGADAAPDFSGPREVTVVYTA